MILFFNCTQTIYNPNHQHLKERNVFHSQVLCVMCTTRYQFPSWVFLALYLDLNIKKEHEVFQNPDIITALLHYCL